MCWSAVLKYILDQFAYPYMKASYNMEILCIFLEIDSLFSQQATVRLIALYKENKERLTDKYTKKKDIWLDIAYTLKTEGLCSVSFIGYWVLVIF